MNSTALQNWNSVCPDGFTFSRITLEGYAPHSIEKTWDWLNRKETFTQGQIPPYRVEFVASDSNKTAEFEEGCYNNHHGPFLHLPAQITVMNPHEYREMQYLYGSYVLSFRLIRPTALKFFLSAHEQGCMVQVVLEAQIRPFIRRLWEGTNQVFWTRFFFPYLKKMK